MSGDEIARVTTDNALRFYDKMAKRLGDGGRALLTAAG